MITIKDTINRIYCERATICYDTFCAVIDCLTDSELAEICEYFDCYSTDSDIIGVLSDVDEVEQILDVESGEIYNRIY